ITNRPFGTDANEWLTRANPEREHRRRAAPIAWARYPACWRDPVSGRHTKTPKTRFRKLKPRTRPIPADFAAVATTTYCWDKEITSTLTKGVLSAVWETCPRRQPRIASSLRRTG